MEPRHRDEWSTAALGSLLCALVLAQLCACPPRPPLPPAHPTDGAALACPGDMRLPVTADICDTFLPSGVACAKCGSGCMDLVDGVFCVPDCVDARCSFRHHGTGQ